MLKINRKKIKGSQSSKSGGMILKISNKTFGFQTQRVAGVGINTLTNKKEMVVQQKG